MLRRATDSGADRVLVGVFLVLVALPLVDRVLGLDVSEALHENRTPERRPDAPDSWETLAAYPAAFERHFNDTFGFRHGFIRLHNRVLVALRTSPVPNAVTVGSDGWLFYAGEGALLDYKGERPFEESELVRWQHLLETRRDWLSDRGIPYVFVIAPNKESVYGEQMPRRIPKGEVHRLDQLTEFLRTHSDFDVLDPRALLLAAKSQGDLYRRTDSHWSQRGAWLVTEAVARRVAKAYPAVTPIEPADLAPATTSGTGDLLGMLGVADLLSESAVEVLPLIRPRALSVGTPTESASWTAVDDPTLPRAVFFHDSFGNVQKAYLAEHFSHLRLAAVPVMDPEIVVSEDAHVVVQEMAERFLARALPDDSMVLADNRRIHAAFAASADVLIRFDGDPSVLEPTAPLTIGREHDGAAVLRVTQAPGSLRLPAMQMTPGSSPVLRIAVESPADARLVVWYQTGGASEYGVPRRVWWPLHPGANVAWMTLHDPELTGRLRIDVTEPGTYVLTSLEVRAVVETRWARGSSRTLSPVSSPSSPADGRHG